MCLHVGVRAHVLTRPPTHAWSTGPLGVQEWVLDPLALELVVSSLVWVLGSLSVITVYMIWVVGECMHACNKTWKSEYNFGFRLSGLHSKHFSH